MTVQAFVDESKRRGIYLVCAVLVDPKELAWRDPFGLVHLL